MVKRRYVGKWQHDSLCVHGVPIPYRWVGESEDSSEPEFGENKCPNCAKEYRKTVLSGYEYEGKYGLA